MKTRQILLLLISVVFVLHSCDWDDDDNYAYSGGNAWVGFGLTKNVEADSYTIKIDDGPVLYPVSTSVPGFVIKPDQRLLVNFSIFSEKNTTAEGKNYYVQINSLKEILYKDIFEITEATEDSIGNDPIHVEEAWLSGNMLTFQLSYYGHDKLHYINLVKPEGEVTSEDEPVTLELRHNNNNDNAVIKQTDFVTFKLDNIKVDDQDSVRFKVTGIDFNNVAYLDSGVYRYGD